MTNWHWTDLDWQIIGLDWGLPTFLEVQVKKFAELNFRPGGGPLGFVVLDHTRLAVNSVGLVNFLRIGSKLGQIGWSVNPRQFI